MTLREQPRYWIQISIYKKVQSYDILSPAIAALVVLMVLIDASPGFQTPKYLLAC